MIPEHLLLANRQHYSLHKQSNQHLLHRLQSIANLQLDNTHHKYPCQSDRHIFFNSLSCHMQTHMQDHRVVRRIPLVQSVKYWVFSRSISFYSLWGAAIQQIVWTGLYSRSFNDIELKQMQSCPCSEQSCIWNVKLNSAWCDDSYSVSNAFAAKKKLTQETTFWMVKEPLKSQRRYLKLSRAI